MFGDCWIDFHQTKKEIVGLNRLNRDYLNYVTQKQGRKSHVTTKKGTYIVVKSKPFLLLLLIYLPRH